MSSKDEALEEIERLLKSVGNGTLDEWTAAYTVAEYIVEFKDSEIIVGLPPNISEMIKTIASEYEETGEFKVYSSVGCADHTELAASLSSVLKEVR
ncbi:hypothetical protein ACJJIF_18250 [Microbulbifer sp. SSSA002]|uniref:hypothetical protein n=1 Tax=Microbulbifer sp. SSSA002 TaxID=3243376 RepID=UPI004039E91E